MGITIPGRTQFNPYDYNISENFDTLDNWTVTQSSGAATVSVAGNILTVSSTSTTSDTIRLTHNQILYGRIPDIFFHTRCTEKNVGGGYGNRIRSTIFARSYEYPDRYYLAAGMHMHDTYNQLVWDSIRPASNYGVNISSPTIETSSGWKDIGDIDANDVSDGTGWKPPAGTYRIGHWLRMTVCAEIVATDEVAKTALFMDIPQSSTSDDRLARYNNEATIPDSTGWFKMSSYSSNHVKNWVENRSSAEVAMDQMIQQWVVGMVIIVVGDGANASTWETQKFRAKILAT